MTLAELQSNKRMSIRTTSCWQSRVSGNAPVCICKAEIIYTNREGARGVFGIGLGKTKKSATKKAWVAALETMNSED